MFTPIGIVHTPASVAELKEYMDKFSGSDYTVAFTVGGMSWNLCSKMFDEAVVKLNDIPARLEEIASQDIYYDAETFGNENGEGDAVENAQQDLNMIAARLGKFLTDQSKDELEASEEAKLKLVDEFQDALRTQGSNDHEITCLWEFHDQVKHLLSAEQLKRIYDKTGFRDKAQD